jgi:septum site-determining protein MinC
MKSAKISVENSPSFELKGSALTLMVLHILEADSETLIRELQDKFGQTPGFFKNAPLMIELAAVQETTEALDFPLLIETLRGVELIPVGVRSGNTGQNEAAIACGLGILSPTKSAQAEAASPQAEPQTVRKPSPSPMAGAKVLTQPIRAGQRVVAAGDLIVLASVNAGAEILAVGNIHVYGALRGRAFAGGQGDTEARVFCMQFNPDLVAVAGEYLVNEDLDQAHIGKTVVVSLENDRLKIVPIGTFDPFG